MTVDKWFAYWVENIICDLAPNTIRNYQERYKWNIQPVIGSMCIADVKPNGNHLCRFYHSAGLYHNGNRVKIGSYE